ncbi:Tetratricopeptide TPR_1 repeat-containing protein [Isosphaera pallida ATCC 43644]|uniref:Tetratricopeptide TPR_1 repeat-containing protein n=1 Tax=Isosphaera pallida (strain ATCC 43644 / DSM 9630 / IS1B) TaxID=575540 RepID=E8QXZ1_ISOPI|nr:Tetratricopeptide TPR_1 repeat-containing protein [Isosphaera pallida ATCC 43644]
MTRTIVLVTIPILLVGWTWFNLASDDRLERAAEFERRGEYDPQLWNQTIRLSLDYLNDHPWSRQAARQAARGLCGRDFPDLAEPYFQRAGTLTQDDLHVRAYAITRSNRRDEAVQAYREIVQRDPTDVLAWQRMGGVLISQSKYDEALEVARRLIELPEGQVIGHQMAGLSHHANRDYGPAMDEWDALLKLDPRLEKVTLPHEVFWFYVGFDALQMGRADDVLTWLTPVVTQELDSPTLWALIGQAHQLQGEHHQAEAAFRRAVDRAPDYAVGWTYLGRTLLALNRPEEAVAALRRAIEQDRDIPAAYYALSQAQTRLGRRDLAQAALKEFQAARKRLDPNRQPNANTTDADNDALDIPAPRSDHSDLGSPRG